MITIAPAQQSLWAFVGNFHDTNYGIMQFETAFSAEFLNTQDGLGNTLLHHATIYHRIDIVEFLLGQGANPNIRNSSGQLPSDIAQRDAEIVDVTAKEILEALIGQQSALATAAAGTALALASKDLP